MEDKDVIQLILDQAKEHNSVIKEYQHSIRMVILVCMIALCVMFVAQSISTAYQVHRISSEAGGIVETYFQTDYGYGTIENNVEIGD